MLLAKGIVDLNQIIRAYFQNAILFIYIIALSSYLDHESADQVKDNTNLKVTRPEIRKGLT